MMMVARIIYVSVAAAAVVAGLAFVFLQHNPDYPGLILLLGCVGAIVGAIAGATREIVAAYKQNANPEVKNGKKNVSK